YRERGEEVPIGFIGSVNNLVVEQLPEVGVRLYTAVRVVQEVFNVTLIEAETATETETVARCKMKIFLQQ
ncbi:MAG: hydroxymyristoyl-ACP dehydratase, partial [Alistipes sp.]|nr:hydroxymyristoyl-ACP dehydratase [Alistipes sp.]